jgi:hypothetical protein
VLLLQLLPADTTTATATTTSNNPLQLVVVVVVVLLLLLLLGKTIRIRPASFAKFFAHSAQFVFASSHQLMSFSANGLRHSLESTIAAAKKAAKKNAMETMSLQRPPRPRRP